MSRRLLFIAGFAVSSAVIGWGQTAPQSTTTPPVNEPFGGPILVTPSAGFPNPTPAAGISDAGRAGISNSTNGTEMTTAPSTPATIVTSPSTVSPSELTQQMPANDSGTSFFVSGAADASGARTTSLAEVSSRYKAEKATRNAQVLDNEDVQRMLDNKSGVTTAKNMPPLGPGATQQPPTQNAGIPPATTQSAQENTPPAQNSAPSQGTAASPAQNQSASPDKDAANSTTPRINQNQQSNDTQGSGRLPATATFLPLLGLLGLVSGGIGFWFRKLRN
jgi:hypothetical protein